MDCIKKWTKQIYNLKCMEGFMNRRINFKFCAKILPAIFMFLIIGIGTASAAGLKVYPFDKFSNTEFSYQGFLKESGDPANGLYDFQFSLFNSASNGQKLGITVMKEDIIVIDGVFQAVLDFNYLITNTCYLQIEVRPGTITSSFTLLSPRQSLSPVPFALYSVTASALQGMPFSSQAPSNGQFLVWNDSQWEPQTVTGPVGPQGSAGPQGLEGQQGVKGDVGATGSQGIQGLQGSKGEGAAGPQGLKGDTGADGSQGPQGSTGATGATGPLGPEGLRGPAGSTNIQNVIYVAKSGAAYTSIQAAIDSISNAEAANPYLVWIAPGVYSERVTLKPYINLEGAGEHLTKITQPGNKDLPGTIKLTGNTELRFLTVEAINGTSPTAIYHDTTEPTWFTNITVIASSTTTNESVTGMRLTGESRLTEVSINVNGMTNLTGIHISKTAYLNHVNVQVMNNSPISLTDTPSGIRLGNEAYIKVTDSDISATNAYGIFIDRGSSRMGSLQAYQSRIAGIITGGAVAAISAYGDPPNGTPPNWNGINIAYSQVDGAVQLYTTDNLRCLGNFNKNFVEISSICQ